MKKHFLNFMKSPKYIAIIYVLVAILCALSKYFHGVSAYNNYVIFKNVYFNCLQQKNLYLYYTELYQDHNLYGVFFSVLIAPFALLPDYFGMPLWNACNALVFVFAILQIPIPDVKKSMVLLLCFQEFITSSVSLQFNIALVGFIIFASVAMYKNNETQAVIAILIGFFVKIYGIVGLSAFFFVRDKRKFVISFVFVFLLFFILPMLLFGPDFVVKSYDDWFYCITDKNAINGALNTRQDYSVMGIFRRVLQRPDLPNLLFIFPGMFIFFLPYFRISQYKNMAFRLLILSSTLLFVVLFSSSSESSTYIIAVPGVMIWFALLKEKSKWNWLIMLFVIILTSFGFSDLFTKYIKENYIIKYSLKALPCLLAWIKINYDLLIEDFESSKFDVLQWK